ncbi:MAG: nicotinate phosphoribosyltransferase [Desulfarculaceae bacterium]|nr:nicotinate phosphoribosyltransferase [Desulfarculaceae bacterium]MCF8070945.1 nicotinate phosphoribosyltransferase [Desulfarculaceae bacterium]MCF8100533.1 nicotinate phosphoribosyltransferase [Desulfarculaceae bacterium]MCF8116559.1 nicotinate phosphoribosyltransferase [Desulfarculaceae bacterium]
MSETFQALHTDFYQLTMAAAYHRQGMNQTATFSLFAHGLPAQRGYILTAGLADALDYLERFRFTPEEIDYLASLERFTPEFLGFLAGLSFSGEAWALPEGTACFAGEPLIEITAPLIEAQLVETRLIQILNLHSTLASKAARCVQAAQGRTCVDFALRRTQGREAGWAAARSSSIAGFAGTSNVEASWKLGTVPVGTMAHAFVEAFGDELTAFRAFADTFPKGTVLLVDTYDSVEGLHRAVQVAAELKAGGSRLLGVRLDSGDLVGMSRQARQVLDQAGLEEAWVVVSGSLDETRIHELVSQGAEVDTFGVGTKMGSSADAPYLDLAYKLVSYDGRPTVKLSTGKETWASPKQLWRHFGPDGLMTHDVLGLRGEDQPGLPLLMPVMAQGRRLEPEPGWRAAQERFREQAAALPEACLRLAGPAPLEYNPSDELRRVQEKARQAALNKR